jgi:adenosylhomocysteine nucleosidase
VSSAPSSPVLVVTAVAAETRAVLAAFRQARRIPTAGFRVWEGETAGRAIRLVQSGIGPERARTALHAFREAHGVVMSVGFAGALIVGPKPGDLVLPSEVVWEDPDGVQRYSVPVATWRAIHARVPAHLANRVLHGALLSSPTIVASTEDKAAAGIRCGAVAVEMEVAGMIPLARERGTALVPLRVILDPADVSLADLPANLDSSWRARGQLLRRPTTWGRVLALAREIPKTSRILTEIFAAVVPGV